MELKLKTGVLEECRNKAKHSRLKADTIDCLNKAELRFRYGIALTENGLETESYNNPKNGAKKSIGFPLKLPKFDNVRVDGYDEGFEFVIGFRY